MAGRRDGRNDSQTEYKWTGVECAPCPKGGFTDDSDSLGSDHHFSRTGNLFHRHSRKIVVVGILVLCLGCLGLETATRETDIESLLVQDEGQISEQFHYMVSSRGKGSQPVRQVVLQIPRVPEKSVLSVDSLIQHFNLLHSVTKVSVDRFGITWRLKDICRSVGFPNFDDDSAIDQILKSLEACIIITPLDCFWEGSKLLGPDYGAYFPSYSNGVKWSNLNPEKIVQSFNQMGIHFPHEEEIDKLLKRAGITLAYQELPCLNPFDPECPVTAPNYLNKQLPDVEKVLANGCTGFATRFMVWDEDLIIGGMSRSASGRILRAEAVKSIVQLMGEKELYDFYRDTYKVHGLNWNQSFSREVLEAWQRMFAQAAIQFNLSNIEISPSAISRSQLIMLKKQKIQEMSSVVTANDSLADKVYSLSLLNLKDCLADASKVDFRRVAIVVIALLIYICLILTELSGTVLSKVFLGCAGLTLIVLSTVAGFGICSLVGLKFNVVSEQVLPFMVIGLGASDILLIVLNYSQLTNFDIPQAELFSWCHRECGQVILTASVTVSFSFFFWTICPIPALQSFCFQGAVLIIVNMVSSLLIYPGFLYYDLLRQKKKTLLDSLSSCSTWNHKQPLTEEKVFPPREVDCTYENQVWSTCLSKVDKSICQPIGTISSEQCLIGGRKNRCKENISNLWTKFHCFRLSLFVRNVYAPCLQKTVTKTVVICIFFTSLGVGMFGIMHLSNSLSLAELVPRSSTVHGFLEAEFRHFGFSSVTAVTKDNFDYSSAKGQLLLHSYHAAFHHVDAIAKTSDGQCLGFWLQLFRSWLINVQDAFDIGWRSGCITEDGWLGNSSSDARLGYKLIIQTGNASNPFDRKRVLAGRVVDENGIIYPTGFYIYLSAWASNSAIEFAFSDGNLQPPPRQWLHDKDDRNLEIPKSRLLTSTQLPFRLRNVIDAETAMATIQEIHNISDYFASRGLPNFPAGLIFTFFDQFNSLHLFLGIAIIASLLVFFILCLALMDAWTATIAVVAVAALTIQVLGFLGLFGIGMNVITATVVTAGIGIGAKFTIHLLVKFLMLLGSQNNRMAVALENSISSVVHGSIIAIIGSIGFVSLEFDFITKYIFIVIVAFTLFGVLDGLVFLPVFLSLIGPPAKIDAVSDHKNQVRTLPEQTTNESRPLSVFTTLMDSNTKFVIVNSVTESKEISSDVTFEMSVFCNHGTPKTSDDETIKDRPLAANNAEFSDVNFFENQIRTTIATTKVEVHTHTKDEDELPEFKSKRRKLMTSNLDCL